MMNIRKRHERLERKRASSKRRATPKPQRQAACQRGDNRVGTFKSARDADLRTYLHNIFYGRNYS